MSKSNQRKPFKTDEEIAALVRAFESREIHPAEFKHYQHLTVALWYVSVLPDDEASEKMKNGIRRLAASHGKTGYHETITVFWLKLVRDFLANSRRENSIAVLANQLIEKYADKNFIFDYYSAELLASPEAKGEWVEPDLRPLDFGC